MKSDIQTDTTTRPSFKERLSQASASKAAHPGYGQCGRCFLAWPDTKGHTTEYSESGGCFPLCEDCWTELTPKERLPYYRQLWLSWHQWGPVTHVKWEDIEAAVLAGK